MLKRIVQFGSIILFGVVCIRIGEHIMANKVLNELDAMRSESAEDDNDDTTDNSYKF